MKFSRTKNWLHTLAVVAITGVAMSILLLLFDQTVKDSGPAEWLSALLNLVMAVAAVLAYRKASEWLPQLTTQEGYKLAISLVNEEFIWLGNKNPLLHEAASLCAAAREAFTERHRRGANKSLSQAITRLENVIEESKRRNDAIEMAMFRMQTYGLLVAEERAVSMNAMLRGHADSFSYAIALLAPIRSNHDNRMERMSTPVSHSHPEQNTWLREIAENDTHTLKESDEAYKKLHTAWHQMVKGHEDMIGSDHRIGKLFIVRKD